MSAIDGFVIAPKPAAHFGVGAISQLGGIERAPKASSAPESSVLSSGPAGQGAPAVA